MADGIPSKLGTINEIIDRLHHLDATLEWRRRHPTGDEIKSGKGLEWHLVSTHTNRMLARVRPVTDGWRISAFEYNREDQGDIFYDCETAKSISKTNTIVAILREDLGPRRLLGS